MRVYRVERQTIYHLENSISVTSVTPTIIIIIMPMRERKEEEEEDEDNGDAVNDNKTTATTTTATPPPPTNLSPEQKAQRERKMTTLQASISKLESQIADTEAQLSETRSSLKSPDDVSDTIKNHIRSLHSYNEIKDVGQGLMGLIAEARGVRYVDVQREFGIEAGD
jgi:DNA repair protein Swi5/Sae3